MSKKRSKTPKEIRERVLKEFNYRCAIGGEDNPQIHHIDGDPNNHNAKNLIPLCPNHHLTDQHNPTEPMDPHKLRLFRLYKDPTILSSQFHPLFLRLRFLEIVDDTDSNTLSEHARELIDFVTVLQMGTFYAPRIERLIKSRHLRAGWASSSQTPEEASRLNEVEQTYRAQLKAAKEQVYELAIELLRYQDWLPGDK